MNIVYYRDGNKDWEITRCHGIEMDEDQLQAAVEKYNLEHPDREAGYAVLDEGSLEEYLFKHAHERIKLDRETLEDLKNALDNCQEIVFDLIMQMEESSK